MKKLLLVLFVCVALAKAYPAESDDNDGDVDFFNDFEDIPYVYISSECFKIVFVN